MPCTILSLALFHYKQMFRVRFEEKHSHFTNLQILRTESSQLFSIYRNFQARISRKIFYSRFILEKIACFLDSKRKNQHVHLRVRLGRWIDMILRYKNENNG